MRQLSHLVGFSVVSVTTLSVFCVGTTWADIPICDADGNHPIEPFCMPADYNKDLVPPTEGPLNVNVDIWVFEASSISMFIFT